MRALVTGADGFVGRWLTRHLRNSGDEVLEAVGGASQPDSRSAKRVEMADRASIDDLINWAAPDAVYHLAAVAFGPDAARSIERAVGITVEGTTSLLMAAARLKTSPIVLVPSSSEVYGVPRTLPIDEDHPVHPSSVYGATKLAQEAVALAFHHAGAVRVVVARAFNHIGPGQREHFVVPSLALQLATLSRDSLAGPLVVGNLDAERDFTDVRDVVRAYRRLVEYRYAGQPVNVASGSAISIRQLLDELMVVAGLEAEIQVDPTRLRPVDAPRIVGSAERLHQATEWRPSIPRAETIRDIWHDAVTRIHASQ